MNTLKPLLIVAVLAGIGYGVYVRLNRGNGEPPPVAEGWDAIPDVQLPDQTTGAPWSPPPAEAAGSGPLAPPEAASATTPDPGGVAPAFTPPVAAAPGQTPPIASQAPPFGQAAGAADAPPNAADQPTGAPPFGSAGSAAPPANPNEYPAPPGPGTAPPAQATQDAPLVDPYAGVYDAGTPDPSQASPAEGVPPSAYPPPATASATPNQGPTSGNPPPAVGNSGDFTSALDSAKRQLEGGQMAEALRQLSAWYGRGELAPAEQQQLHQLLDQVAGTVIYSTQNLIEPPYEVQPGERLEDIGDKYGVPWQLLAKINGIDDPAALRPGERLKVVRGPFEAVVSLEKRELTLFAADGLYAGRFKIGIGIEHPPGEGTFPVAEKVLNPVYYGRDRAISAEDATNPLGEQWIGLGGGVGIHGTNNPQSIGRTDLPGSISLSERDIADVFDILSLGSRVTIRR